MSKRDHDAVLDVLRTIRDSMDRKGWCNASEVTVRGDLNARTLGELIKMGYVHRYPGSHGAQRVNLTDIGKRYALNVLAGDRKMPAQLDAEVKAALRSGR
jgi:DNA-binding MarR family transcriptional regulator